MFLYTASGRSFRILITPVYQAFEPALKVKFSIQPYEGGKQFKQSLNYKVRIEKYFFRNFWLNGPDKILVEETD
jgi:hypothetical protein